MVRARRGSLPLSSEKLAATLPFAVPAAVLLLRVRLRRRLRAMVSGMVRARRGSLPLSSETLAATLSFAVPTAALLLRVWARVEMCKEKEKPPYPTDLTQISLLLLSLLFGRWLLFFANCFCRFSTNACRLLFRLQFAAIFPDRLSLAALPLRLGGFALQLSKSASQPIHRGTKLTVSETASRWHRRFGSIRCGWDPRDESEKHRQGPPKRDVSS